MISLNEAYTVSKREGRSFMNEENGKEIRLTELDYLVADPHIQMMKAAVPYMQPPQQRIFSMIISSISEKSLFFSSGAPVPPSILSSMA